MGCTDYLKGKGLHEMAQAHRARRALDSSDAQCNAGGKPLDFLKCKSTMLNLKM